ncbi:MAG: helix-turn-helix domain-containing protein [Patescibacteria group bacterium]|nr:helix-turn-helix domain-containing protein [Patescibacteria group bacterium]
MTPEQVIDHFGGASETAKKLRMTRAIVSFWRRNKRIPPKTQRLIELETKGKLKADNRK